MTVKEAIERNLISTHASADGTLARANASFKSFEPIKVAMSGEEYKDQLRKNDNEEEIPEDREKPKANPDGDNKQNKDDDNKVDNGTKAEDRGNPDVNFRGEKRSNKTHRSRTDRDCRFVSKGSSGTGAYPGYTVNAIMENRNRFLLGMGADIFQGPLSETEGCLNLLDRIRRRLHFKVKTPGGDKGNFSERFIEEVMNRGIEPHIAPKITGKKEAHKRVRMRVRGTGYKLSQLCRKKIEELFGEAKDQHGMRRVKRRGIEKINEEIRFIGWVLNLKWMAKVLNPVTA